MSDEEITRAMVVERLKASGYSYQESRLEHRFSKVYASYVLTVTSRWLGKGDYWIFELVDDETYVLRVRLTPYDVYHKLSIIEDKLGTDYRAFRGTFG